MLQTENTDRVSIIKRVTWLGFWINAVLMALKLAFGLYGNSAALVADGFHSMSDFATDFIVLVMVGIAYKRADSTHPYGHGKFETFASLLIAVILLAVALGIVWNGLRTGIMYINGEDIPRPDVWTIIVAAISILSKEWLFRYTFNIGKAVDSAALRANAWHHRSDAVSSVATLVAVTGAYLLGDKFRILDPAASIIIGVFIAVSAYKIGRPSVDELLEGSLPPDQVDRIRDIIRSEEGVLGFHKLKTRRSGNSRIIDVDIKVDPDISVTQGHGIATRVERSLKKQLGDDLFIYIHIEPYNAPEISDKVTDNVTG